MRQLEWVMINTIKEHILEVHAFQASTKEQLEEFRIKYLGGKGIVKEIFAAFKKVYPMKKRKHLDKPLMN